MSRKASPFPFLDQGSYPYRMTALRDADQSSVALPFRWSRRAGATNDPLVSSLCCHLSLYWHIPLLLWLQGSR